MTHHDQTITATGRPLLMAGAQGIAVGSGALRTMVAEHCAAEGAALDIALRRQADLPGLAGDGVAIILLGVEPARTLRDPGLPGRSDERRTTGSIALDIRYLLVPHAQEPERQQRLLGLLFEMAAATPVLGPAALNAASDDGAMFAPGEMLNLVVDPMSVEPGTLLPPAMLLRVGGFAITPPQDASNPVATRWPRLQP